VHLIGFVIRIYHEFRPDPARKLSANLYELLCAQWKTADDGQRNRPKHVEFYSKNKFEKLVDLVGHITRIYHEFHPDPALKLSANLYDIYHCYLYSEKLLMMDRGTVRNM